MVLRACFLITGVSIYFCLAGCSKSAPPQTRGNVHLEVVTKPMFEPLLNRIWRVSSSAYGPAAGSIYIFLQNGTLLETSCVETYRVATWSVIPTVPPALRVVEDQREAFTASLGEAAGNTLVLHQKLLHETEARDITLTAVDGEFVCPDLPKR
jgi:hypothetical protein